MIKTKISLLVVCVLALSAWARGDVGADGFDTGTSFEYRESGVLDVDEQDPVDPEGDIYWSMNSSDGAIVKEYDATSPAYDYKTKGTVRAARFTEKENPNDKYLSLDVELSMERLVAPRTMDIENYISNVFVKTTEYDGIYADTLVKMTPCVAAPDVDSQDRVVVWLRENEENGVLSTNLMVTAGRYVDDFKNVERCDYVIATPRVSAGDWCRLTIRAISDVTGNGTSGKDALGFEVYVDGQRVVGDEDYDVGTGYDAERMTPEARTLVAERRLFPSLTKPGFNASHTLSRMSFSGLGAIDDVRFTTARPAHVVSNGVFTLQWDVGVTRMDCIVAYAGRVETNAIVGTALPRYRDFALGTNAPVRVIVTNVVYNTEKGYSNGVWRAENCDISENVFTCREAGANAAGLVASSRNYIGIGDGGCETFAEAKMRAYEKGTHVVVLNEDIVVSSGLKSGNYVDNGQFSVTNGDDIVLDLMGHTLRGSDTKPLPTVYLTGGRLRITDSSDEGTGRIVPSEKDTLHASVRSDASAGRLPELIIDAGWYDGAIIVTGRVGKVTGSAKYIGTCIVEGGGFTNIYDEAQSFYIEQYVTNTSQYFGCDENDYWTSVTTNGYIWSGKGGDTLWSNAGNWRCQEVPGADALAVFPRITDSSAHWSVDFGEGVATKRMIFDADVAMSGTNEFSDVSVVYGTHRLIGTGTAKFTAATGTELPGRLTSDDASDGEVRLGSAWRGTVWIANVNKAQVLKDIMYWGNSNSRVVFNGVRGYLSDRTNYALPYALTLVDAEGASAWRNETGYTGSVVSFPELSGDGTFESPKNLREIQQVFQFKDVRGFTGKFKLGGKRVLLGTGSVASGSKAGYFTFSDNVGVRSGLGEGAWTGVGAHFGTTLSVYGHVGEELMTYTDASVTPSVENVTVNLYDPVTGKTNGTCRLSASNGKILLCVGAMVQYQGQSIPAESIGTSAKAGDTFVVPDGSAVSIEGDRVIVNGVVVSTFPNYYLVKSVAGKATQFAVQFNEEEVTPNLADFELDTDGAGASICVENAKKGLWYGLQSVTSLADGWEGATTQWQQATGDTVTFEPDVSGAASFYRVVTTDRDPTGGAK